MSSSFMFNYSQFYNYYTDKNNLLIDPTPPIVSYYKPFSSSFNTNSSLKVYILINNERFYVTENKGKLLFTFPTQINGNVWDFHYHFGVNPSFSYKKSKPYAAVFFHKTEQIPSRKSKQSTNCYFPDNTNITNVSDILCAQTDGIKMSGFFPGTGPDFKYIEEIICRPFLGVRLGGGNKTIRSKQIIKRRTMKNKDPIISPIKYLSLEQFLKYFESEENLSFLQFLSKAQVKVGENMEPLKEYMERKHIEKAKIKLLYENIKHKNDYLTRFYNMSLRVLPERMHIIEPPMKNRHMNNNLETTYKNVIRNLHYKDILENTQSGIENVPTFIKVLKDLYFRAIIDYKIITPSALHYMENGRLGSVFSSFYFRASIMNPYLVYSLNHSTLKGTRIFTPTLGWTSYCYGFLECPYVIEYVGTDVISSVCQKTDTFAKTYYPEKTVKIYCHPSEDLAKSERFKKKYHQHFDVVFFSPPYYKLELYPGEDQSTDRYKTYEEWLANYWEETIKLCYYVLQKGGKLCYILSGYGSESVKEEYDLLGDMNRITKKHFQFQSKQPMYNKDVHSTKHKETAEQIMIFVK